MRERPSTWTTTPTRRRRATPPGSTGCSSPTTAGGLDGIHGWHARGVASREQAFRLEAPAGQRVAHGVVRVDRGGPAPRPGCTWCSNTACRRPTAGPSVRAEGKPLPVRGAADGGRGHGPGRHAGRRCRPACRRTRQRRSRLRVEGPAGAVLEVRNAMVTNLSRARVAADARFLAEYDLRYALYSEHCPGPQRANGRPPEGRRRRHPAGCSGRQPGRRRQLLRAAGVRARRDRVHQRRPPDRPAGRPADHLPRRPAPVQRRRRPLHLPAVLRLPDCADDGSLLPPRNEHSWEPWLGFHLGQLLAHSGRFGDGGTIYTHWGVGNPKDLALSPATRNQLELLARALLQPFRRALPTWDRVWVAPTAELLLYARDHAGRPGERELRRGDEHRPRPVLVRPGGPPVDPRPANAGVRACEPDLLREQVGDRPAGDRRPRVHVPEAEPGRPDLARERDDR